MRTLPLSVLSALTLAAFGLMALGSSNSSDKGATGAAAGSAAPGAAAPGGGEKQAVLATCVIKYGGKLGKCTENYGAVPTMAADMCKGDEGTFATGSTPCPAEGQTGRCEFKAASPGAPGEAHYYYPGSVGDPKGSCEALGAVWTAAAAKAAPSAAAPKK